MIACFIPGCRWKTTCPALFGLHLRRLHEPIDVYTCSEPNCGRRFSVRCSFIAHIKKHARNDLVDVESRIGREQNTTASELCLIDGRANNDYFDSNDCTTKKEETTSTKQNETDNHIQPKELINIEKLSQEFTRLSIGFNLKWLNKSSVPRKLVFEFQEDVRTNILKPIQEVVEIIADSGLISTSGKNALGSIFSMFSNTQSEYQFVRQLKSMKLYEDPVYFTICNELRPGVIHHKLDMIVDDIKGVLMPIRFQLKKCLESAGMMNAIIDCLKPSNDGVIRSLIDGKIWQEKVRGSNDKLVIPINIFIDDFTTSDTVSPHASSTKISGIYYYIPCLPPYVLSKLHNIHIAGFFMSEDRKRFGNNQILYKLVEIFTDLELNGLNIMYEGQEINVYFMIGFVTGDNLGLSETLRLVESPAANFYCRVCKRTKSEREKDCKEFIESLRSKEEYDDDVRLDDVSRTGIKGNCILNDVPSFHVSRNIYFDIMHDVSEGICLYGLSHCLKYFVYKKKYFTLDDLNCRKNLFIYGHLNSANIPNDIKDTNLAKQKVKMTANEINTLTRFLPLMIGSMVPRDDPVWQYLCSLLKIYDIVMLHDIPLELIEEFRKLVEFHHYKYVYLFQDSLKPKHHNIVHYATAVTMSGSLRRQWGMRCEAKHKEAKQYCRVNYNKRNICSSLITKFSFKYAFDVFNNQFITPFIDIKKENTFCSELSDILKPLVNSITCAGTKSIKFVSQFTKQGSLYQKGTIFFISQKLIRNVYEIESMILINDKNIVLLCYPFNSTTFDEHLQSFQLKRD